MSVEMSQERKAQVDMMIRFFNMQAGTSYKCSTENNQNVVNTAIEKSNGNIVELKNYVRSYVNEQKGNSITDCFESYEGCKKEEPVAQPKQEITPEKPEFAMAVLEKVIMQTIAQTQYDFNNEKMQNASKEIFGDNAVWFGCVKIIEKNEDYVKEVLINAGNKKSTN